MLLFYIIVNQDNKHLKFTVDNNLTYHLECVINALNKAEKKRFQLYLNKNTDKENLKFVQLFRFIEKYQKFDQTKFLAKHPSVKLQQLSNLKRHLLNKVLQTLRLKEGEHDTDIKIREQLDNAQALFNKGLYPQSLWVLDNAKSQAKKWQRELLLLEVLHLEKLIELHFVTGRPSSIAKELTEEASFMVNEVEKLNTLSGLALTFYGLYQEKGYVRNPKEYEETRMLFFKLLPKINYKDLSVNQKIYYHQAFFWYNYIIQNFTMCYKHALKWVDIIEQNDLTLKLTAQYFRGLNSLLSSLFRLNYKQKFLSIKEKLLKFKKENFKKLNQNLKVMQLKYEINHSFNLYFMEGNFELGVKEIPEVLEQIEDNRQFFERRYINSVYYKIASMYFGAGKFNEATVFLNKILYQQFTNLRQDINSFARILLTVCYFEMKNEFLLANTIRSTYHYLGRNKDLNLFQKEIFKFLKKTSRMDRYQTQSEFRNLYNKMIVISEKPYEQRPFYYFDIISWLESKFEKRPISEIIKERGLGHKKLFNTI